MERSVAFSAFTLALFVFSGVVFAEEGSGSDETMVGTVDATIAADTGDGALPRLGKGTDAVPSLLPAERLKQVRAQVDVRVASAVKERNLMEEFDALKERIRTAAAKDRATVRAEARVTAKAVLVEQLSSRIAKLEALKAAGVGSANIDVLIDFYTDQKSKLEASEDLNAGILAERSKALRAFEEKHRLALMKEHGLKTNARFVAIVTKAERFSERLRAMISTLEESGKDATKLTEAVDALDAHIETYNGVHASLKAEMEAAETIEDIKAVHRKIQASLQRVHAQLMEDFRLFKALFLGIREIAANGSISAETEAEIAANSEDDSSTDDGFGDESMDNGSSDSTDGGAMDGGSDGSSDDGGEGDAQ